MNAKPKRAPLSGLEKTAILFNVLGKEKSFELMKEMKDPDVRRVLKVMGTMNKAPLALINSVLREFLDRVSEREEILFEENLSRPEVVSEGLGAERAKVIFGNRKAANLVHRRNLPVLDMIDPPALAEFLKEEHPQTIALVLSHMEVAQQLQVLKLLPETLSPEVLLRMANLEYVSAEKVDELDEILRKELVGQGRLARNPLGGVAAVADLLNHLDKRSLSSLMARLEDKDPMIAESIRQQIFAFSDLMKVDERGLRLLLREVPGERWLLALKSAPEELRERIYRVLSGRAAELMREDLAALGPQKVSDVEAAQREIIKAVKRMMEEGRVRIGISEETELIP